MHLFQHLLREGFRNSGKTEFELMGSKEGRVWGYLLVDRRVAACRLDAGLYGFCDWRLLG